MLKRKMVRDISQNISQFITIFLMILIGIMAYVGIEAYMDGMQNTADTFYEENNLEDLILMGSNFTKEDISKIKSLDNILDAERKITTVATCNNDKTLLLNFIESNNISKFYIIDGDSFSYDKKGVWLDNFFAKENNLKVEDTLTIKYDSMTLEEPIVALINVPDHLYDLKDESELIPNREEYGFAYLSTNEIPENYIKESLMKKMNIDNETIFNNLMPNFDYQAYIPFNYVMVTIEDNKKIDDTKILIEDNISSAKAIINVEDTTSYRTYQGEIDEGKTYVGVFSGLFLFIAMLSVITTMTRVVQKQRTQIGTLKALGFKDSKIILHYISYSLGISILSAIFGIVLGYFFIGKIFINMETSFFEIPNGHPVISTSSYLVSIIVILVTCLITYLTCLNILKENPASSLRTKIPSVNKNTLNITTKGLFKNMSFSSKWNLRDILRNKARTIMGITGIIGSSMLIVCALGMLNSMNHFIELQFHDLYNFNYKLSLKEDITTEQIKTLEDIYGANTSATLAIEIKKDNKRETNNIFVTSANDYIRFIDNKENYIKLDNDKGVYITYKLASTLGYSLGDTITWHIYGNDTYYESTIVGFNKDPQNQNITMTRNYLESLGITYKPDSLYTNKDLSNIDHIENVILIQDVSTLENGINNMLSTMKTMIVLIIFIAIVLGAIIIYNLGILSYTEKQYQFATLKVLGFKDKQIKKIFIKQNNWIAIIGIIIGLPLGKYLTSWLFHKALEEHYDFTAHIIPLTYICAALGTFIVSYLISTILSKKITHIDMVSSLKGNE